MSRPAIIEKLIEFLDAHLPFTEECHVVYLLVEIRKLLDQDNSKKYPLIKFYCDWCVHTKKNHISQEIKEIMQQVYSDLYKQITSDITIEKSKVVRFVYFEDVRVEMQSFFTEYDLNPDIAMDEDNWITFISLLVNVLADQPIISPTIDIAEFRFMPADNRCVNGIVTFTKDICSINHFKFCNVY